MKKLFSCLLVMFIFTGLALAQDAKNMDPSQYFDFWIGEWNLTYQENDSTIAKAKNSVTKVLGGQVIQENFEVLSGQNKGYTGKSWSVYNPKTKSWKQTWVDNQGAYLTFEGKIDGPKRIFSRETTNADGKTITQRMVFYDITENSFTWDWEKSEDEGKNWTLLWRIQYQLQN